MLISRSIKIIKFLCLVCVFSTTLKGQVIVTVSPDNCMSPTPNSGTYTQSGTLNGKPMYLKGANLRIIWSGVQWEIQGDDPLIGRHLDNRLV